MTYKWLIPTIIAAVIILYFIFYAVYYCVGLKRRSDYLPFLKYYTVDDYPELHREDFTFKKTNGDSLYAFIYKNRNFSDFKGVITFLHGIGAGHESYTSLIRDLANHGYIVFAYDQSSCGLSDGKGVVSMYGVLEDLSYANRFLVSLKKYDNYPFFIMGHSLGGFGAICSTEIELSRQYDKIVDISGACQPRRALKQTKIPETILFPILRLTEFMKYRKYAKIKGDKAFAKSTTPTMVIHGSKDTVVPVAVFKRLENISKNRNNVTMLELENRRHQPHLTAEAEDIVDRDVLKIILKEIFGTKKGKIDQMTSKIDFSKTVIINDELLKQIYDFLDD